MGLFFQTIDMKNDLCRSYTPHNNMFNRGQMLPLPVIPPPTTMITLPQALPLCTADSLLYNVSFQLLK
jgi:hypothetical protein